MAQLRCRLAVAGAITVVAGIGVMAAVPAEKAVPPAVPSIKVKPAATSVRITWKNAGGAHDYQISDGLTIKSASGDRSDYSWRGLKPFTYKCFRVRAVS